MSKKIVTHRLSLDLSNQKLQATVTLGFGDLATHRLVVDLRYGADVVELPPGSYAIAVQNGVDVLDSVTVYGADGAYPNCIIYDVTTAVTGVEGVHEAQFKISYVDEAGALMSLTSPKIAFVVKKDLLLSSNVVLSDPYSAVVLARERAERFAQNASASAAAAKTSEENAAASATAAGASATAAKTSEENAAASATNAAASEAALGEHNADSDAHAELFEQTRNYVDAEIAEFDFVKVVYALPAQGLPNKIYFVPKKDSDTQDLFDEYVWVNKGTADEPKWDWEWIATKQVEVDLTSHNTSSYAHQNLFNRDKLASLIGAANAKRDGLMPSKHHSLISALINILGEDDALEFAHELKAITDAVEVNEDGTVCVGGRANTADTKRSVIVGGHLNEIDAINGFIGAGKLNRAKGHGVFASGYRNELYAIIGGAIGVDIEIGDIDADAQVNRTFGIGAHLKSNADYQLLLGVGNVEDEGAAVIIGGGEVDKGHNLLSRKNIYTLRRSGVPEKGTDLVTKAFVEDLILGGEW